MDLIRSGHFGFPIIQMCQLYNMQALRPSFESSHLYFTCLSWTYILGFVVLCKI